MEIASLSGIRGHPLSRRYCDSATSNRKPSAPLSLLQLDWFLFPLYLKQLNFALGTPIPLYLELNITDGQLIGPQTIDVRLVRTLATHSLTGGVRKVDVIRAGFWEAPGSSVDNIKLTGEIIIGRRLTPSFVFSKCSVQVHLFYALLVGMN